MNEVFFNMWTNAQQQIAPFDPELALIVLRSNQKRRNGGPSTLEEVQQIYGPLIEYSVLAMKAFAAKSTNNPVYFEKLLTKAAQSDPGTYWTMGNHYSHHGNESKALKYYELAVENSNNEVQLANQVNGLVQYYHRKGDLRKAETLADRAAEAYSHKGLGTRSDLYEVQGKWKEAYKVRKIIEERYKDSGQVVKFIIRYKAATGNTDLDHEGSKGEKAIFPNGKKQVALASFQGPPLLGVVLTDESAQMRNSGLKKGDVIVAIYGIKTDSEREYSFIRDGSGQKDLDVIVWNGEKYLALKANPPGKKCGVGIQDYKRPKDINH